MTDDRPLEDSELPLPEWERLDKICDAFEATWKRGDRPAISTYVDQVEPPLRALLFRQLLKTELEIRRACGDVPVREEYTSDYQQFLAVIDEVFQGGCETVDYIRTPGDTSAGPSSSPPPKPKPLEPGEIIGGKFEVRGVLGAGAFGTVYLCWDNVLEREVAVKMSHADDLESSAEFQQQLEEARKVARLEHPGIVPIHEGGVDPSGRFYVAMKAINGPTLRARAKTRHFLPHETAELIAQVAETLAFVHERDIVHRDLKPSNILLTADDKPVLTDFGLALSEETRWEHAGEYAGSPAYMAPEQVLGAAHFMDGRTDIWALGVILYELLTGRRPFRARKLSQLRDEILSADPKPPRMVDRNIPATLEEICLKCLGKAVTDRWNSASELAAALRGEAELGPNPYRGLAAFREEDVDVFFGREEQTTRAFEKFCELHEPVGSQQTKFRLLPLIGPSGCGKSSLARAGLVAELRRRGLPNDETLRVVALTPGAHPMESLAAALARVATDDPTPVAKAREFEDTLRATNRTGQHEGLRRVADAICGDDNSRLVLLIDQFEEIYSLCRDAGERDTFLGCLLHATGTWPGHISAMVTLRSDFLGATQDRVDLNQLICRQAMMVPAMTDEELKRAVAGPAERAGHQFDEAFVSLLVQDAKDRDGALPLLQFALTRVWNGLVSGEDPTETLRRIGGVGGALAGQAQRIYAGLDEKQQGIARRVFLALIQLGEGARDTRRRAVLDSIVGHQDSLEEIHQVIHRFSDPHARLITISALPDGRETVEVTHEALFDQWGTLKSWLDESRDDIRFHRRLEEAATHWHEESRPEGLLWRSPDLDRLRDFRQRALAELTTTEQEFYAASDAQQRASESLARRRLRFYQIMAAVFAVLILATTVLGITAYRAFKQSQQDEAAANTALDFMADAFSRPDPYQEDRSITVAEVLDKAIGLAEEQLADYPTAKVRLLNVIARTFRNLGIPASATEVAQSAYDSGTSALSETHPLVLASMHELAEAYEADGKLDLAVPLYEKVLRLRKQTLGEDHEDTLDSMNSLADAYFDTGRPEEAIALHEETVKRRRLVLGRDHRDTQISMTNLGGTLAADGQFDEAISLLEETLSLNKASLGENHPETIQTKDVLAVTCVNAKRYDDASLYLQQVLLGRRERFGNDHPETISTLRNLALVFHQRLKRPDEAIPLYEELLNHSLSTEGEHGTNTLKHRQMLARCYLQVGRPAEAISLLEQIVDGHPMVVISVVELVKAYEGDARFSDAIRVLTDANELRAANSKFAQFAARHLAAAYNALEQYDLAEQVAKGYLTQSADNQDVVVPAMRALLGEAYVARQDSTRAKETLTRAIEQLEDQADPRNADRLQFARFLLGEALLQANQMDEASALLSTSFEHLHEGFADLATALRFRLSLALDRVVDQWEAREAADEVERWRARRDEVRQVLNDLGQ